MDESVGKQGIEITRNDFRQKQIQSGGLPIGGFIIGVAKTFGRNQATEQGL